jgi:hypothetical protein
MDLNKKFYDIIVKPEYKDYKYICIKIRGYPYLVRMPENTGKAYKELRELATQKIHYRLEHTSPPQKRGAKRKYEYKDKYEANRIYQQTWKSKHLVKVCA